MAVEPLASVVTTKMFLVENQVSLLFTESCSTLLRPRRLQPAGLLCSQDFPGKNTGVGCHLPLQRNIPDPGIEPTSPALAGDSLPLSHQKSPQFLRGRDVKADILKNEDKLCRLRG